MPSTSPHQAKIAIITSNEVPTVKTEDNKMPQNTSHAVMAKRAEPADRFRGLNEQCRKRSHGASDTLIQKQPLTADRGG